MRLNNERDSDWAVKNGIDYRIWSNVIGIFPESFSSETSVEYFDGVQNKAWSYSIKPMVILVFWANIDEYQVPISASWPSSSRIWKFRNQMRFSIMENVKMWSKNGWLLGWLRGVEKVWVRSSFINDQWALVSKEASNDNKGLVPLRQFPVIFNSFIVWTGMKINNCRSISSWWIIWCKYHFQHRTSY